MKIKFTIPFNTSYGQNVFIYGNVKELSNFETSKAIPLSFSKGIWSCEVNFEIITDFEYSYFLKDSMGTTHYESGPNRIFKSVLNVSTYYIKDEWKTFNDETPFLSTAFKKVFFKGIENVNNNKTDIRIICPANNIKDNQVIAISGNCEYLGNWNPDNSLRMFRNNDGNFEINLESRKINNDFEYKFILFSDNQGNVLFKWEEGQNRMFNISFLKEYNNIIINHFAINIPADKPRYAGTAIPVFSLRSKKGFGIGDFSDLHLMVDFLFNSGQKVLQILPINDTTMTHTYTDSYPYGAISVYAIHPIYFSFDLLELNADYLIDDDEKTIISELNSLSKIDFDRVLTIKWALIKKLFKKEAQTTFNSDDYKSFFICNKEWLKNYAVFCYLRDKYNTSDFKKWPDYSSYNINDIESLTSQDFKDFDQISIHYFVQYHLHKQLTKVHNYANSKGIIFKGDIPIGINKHSVEAWTEPHLFNFYGQAGAPPDDFSVRGQNWGFPTYNWDLMEKEGFVWWKKRFKKMSEYFDAYRIDHILGFFRIWEIPMKYVEGIMGHFNPALPMSSSEIYNFGYNFDYECDCTPYIKDYMLTDYFGADKEEIINTFFEILPNSVFDFKEEFNSQLKIEKFFETNNNSELLKYKNHLFSLLTEVLFIQDPVDPNKYHPRISAQFTKSYSDLKEHQKETFNNIYNHYFYNRNNHFWYHNAFKKLPSIISSTGMLVCGEDLGMIPDCVPGLMKELRILSLEIQRMPKDPGNKFGRTEFYPYLSVCTTGTHDTSTMREWWEENAEVTKKYFHEILQEGGIVPEYCEPWICKKIIRNHLDSPSMLTIIPLQDWLSINPKLRRENPMEERINIPSNPKHYWQYRMHLNLEDLVEEKKIIDEIKELIRNSGR